MTFRSVAAFSSAIATLAVAMLTAYVSLRQDVFARPTETQVRQLIDDKTSDKFFEVFRRFDRLDQRFDRIDAELARRAEQRR